MKHEHDWRLAEVKKGKLKYQTVGSSSLPLGKEPDVATYVCDCGETKTEELKGQWEQ
jgi:hypothetical protein